jgi:hypothetical protein
MPCGIEVYIVLTILKYIFGRIVSALMLMYFVINTYQGEVFLIIRQHHKKENLFNAVFGELKGGEPRTNFDLISAYDQ